MKELPIKIRVVKSQLGMAGQFAVVAVIEGFEEKDEAQDHANYLGPIIANAGLFKQEAEQQMQQEQKQTKKKESKIKLLND